MEGITVPNKVSSTAFLPITLTDMAKPDASYFYFGT